MDIKKISLNNTSYDIRDSRVTTNVVNGNAVWTSAGSITVTNAANGNVIKESGISITTSLDSDNTTVPTSLAVKNAIDALPSPMVFKGSLGEGGTITELPTASASNTGHTYKVITTGIYASESAKVGDAFISDGSSWVLIPSGDEPSGTVTSIATGNGLTGGPITSSGEISLVPASKAVFGGIVVGEGLYTTSVHCGFTTNQIAPPAGEDSSPVYAKIPAGTRLLGPGNDFLSEYPATLLKDYFERKYSNVQFVLAAEDTEIAEIHIDDIVFRASWLFYHYQNDWTSVAESLLEYENGYISISIDIDGMLNATFLQDYTNGFEYTAEKAQLKCTQNWRNAGGSGSDSSYRDLNAATQSTAGVMTAADKTKLDGIATGATANTGTVTSVGITQGSGISVSGGPITTSGSITVSHADTSSLSSSSNSGRTYILSVTLDGFGHVTALSTATETVVDTWRPLGTGSNDACAGDDSRLNNSRPASDVYSWAKESVKPSYIMSEIADISVVALTTDVSSSCSITGAANSGKNQVIIYTNATGSDKVVTVPTTYTTPKGEALELTCSNGGYVEINYLNVSGTIYARGL